MEEPTWDLMYQDLAKEAVNLKDAEEVDSNGVDSFLENKVKVASLGDLSEFFRIAADTLVHKAKKDLWRISEDSNGGVVIERLFDPNTKNPIKV
jgi:hypothetical protein